jgi:hypothetical protein
MALVSSVISSARYDLKDTDSTQYTNAQLLDYLNRSCVQLVSYLGSIGSDWVKKSSDLSLLSGNNYVALPTDFSTPISAWIGTNEIEKFSWEQIIYDQRTISTSNKPSRYAIDGSNMIFDTTADANYTVECVYNRTISELALTDTMPFNSEYNQPLRQAIVLIAKNIDEYDVSGDAALYDFFINACAIKTIQRNHNRKYYNLGF